AFQPPGEVRITRGAAWGRAPAAPRGRGPFDPPPLLPGRRVPGEDLAHVPAAARHHQNVRAHPRRAGGVLPLDALVVHAHVVRAEIRVAGARGERARLLVLAAHRAGADVLGVGALLRPLVGDLDGPARLLVDAR